MNNFKKIMFGTALALAMGGQPALAHDTQVNVPVAVDTQINTPVAVDTQVNAPVSVDTSIKNNVENTNLNAADAASASNSSSNNNIKIQRPIPVGNPGGYGAAVSGPCMGSKGFGLSVPFAGGHIHDTDFNKECGETYSATTMVNSGVPAAVAVGVKSLAGQYTSISNGLDAVAENAKTVNKKTANATELLFGGAHTETYSGNGAPAGAAAVSRDFKRN